MSAPVQTSAVGQSHASALRDVRVAIVGSGVSGLGAAIRSPRLVEQQPHAADRLRGDHTVWHVLGWLAETVLIGRELALDPLGGFL